MKEQLAYNKFINDTCGGDKRYAQETLEEWLDNLDWDDDEDNNQYDNCVYELCKIKGVDVYDSDTDIKGNECLGYVELAVITDDYINKTKEIIKKYNFEITYECDTNGSNYDSYCIWFK